jgi:hypothetical protein
MYIAKIFRKGLLWNVKLFDKRWSDQMDTHEITLIGTHKSPLNGRARRWIRDEIARDLVKQHKLEIQDG